MTNTTRGFYTVVQPKWGYLAQVPGEGVSAEWSKNVLLAARLTQDEAVAVIDTNWPGDDNDDFEIDFVSNADIYEIEEPFNQPYYPTVDFHE